MDAIFSLIHAFPDKPWEWIEISRRNDITFEYVLSHLHDHPWEWRYLSLNPRIGSWKNVLAYPDLPWFWNGLAVNPAVPLDIILADPFRFEVSKDNSYSYSYLYDEKNVHFLNNLSQRSDITMDIVLAYPEINWDWKNLSTNPGLTYDIIKHNYYKGFDWEKVTVHPNITLDHITDESVSNILNNYWDFNEVAANPNVTIDMIPRLRTLPSYINNNDLLYEVLSKNPNLPIEYVINNPHLPWDWSYITKNHPSVTIDLIESSPLEIPWELNKLRSNRTLTLDFVKTHPNIDWDWSLIAINPNIQPIDIINYLNLIKKNHKKYACEGLSLNPNIHFGIVISHPNLPWNYPLLSRNPGITIADIISHPNIPWDYTWFSYRSFNSASRLTIQRWWKARYFKRRFAKLITIIRQISRHISCPYLTTNIILMSI
jgi:hypothetical protein